VSVAANHVTLSVMRGTAPEPYMLVYTVASIFATTASSPGQDAEA
jgi:hypothetical protein